MNGLTIEGSCFSQETPDSNIFPPDLKDCTFKYCNLDNVFIPPGNKVENGSQRRFKVQNDLNDWEIDAGNNPVRLVEYRRLEKLGIQHPDPKDIPKIKVESHIDYVDTARNVRA